MIRNQRQIAVTLAVMASVALVANGAIAPAAAANGGESVTEKISAASESVIEDAKFVWGLAKGKAKSASLPVLGDDPESWSADGTADKLVQDVDGNSSTYQAWMNDRLDVSTDRDVMAVTLENRTANATLYVHADVANGSYQNLTATRSTNQTVDETCTVAGDAGRNAPEELATFRTKFAEPNKNVSGKYMGRMAGQYSNDIDCTFINE